MAFDLRQQPQRRYDPLTRQWILVSPQRTQRPWLGQTERVPAEKRPRYDAECYLCPGNMRAGGIGNPDYVSTLVFDNDFPALLPFEPGGSSELPLEASHATGVIVSPEEQNLLRVHQERGICRVICFSPRHDLTLPEMATEDIRQVVDVWAEQTEEMGARAWIRHVQVFENKGSMMGASNPHPHGQIWANETLPHVPELELAAQTEYRESNGRCLLCDYLALEEKLGERVVCSNDHFVALVPFWAVWPFETLLLSRRHLRSLPELADAERDSLAAVIQALTIRYDNLFEIAFPYSMGFHQQPTGGQAYPAWHLHAHYYPPLLRSATVRKFMVGYEMLAEPQRDIPAEVAAERLRELPDVHYTAKT